MRLDQSSTRDELKSLLEENLKYTKQVLANTDRTRRYIFWISLSNWVKTVIFLAPLLLAAIFLPPLIKKTTDYLNGLTRGLPASGGLPLPNPDQLRQYEELLKKQGVR